jgi:hypothetical protein
MARTNLPVSAFVAEGSLADPAGTTIDQANGMNVVMTSETIPPAYDAECGVFLRVHNTAAGTQHVIVRAGANPPAFRAPLGDLTVAIATGAVVWVGPLDMSRHAQSDDSINVDFDAGSTGTITAFVAPRTV